MGLLDRFLGRTSPAQFANRLIRALRNAGDTDDLRYDAKGRRILRHHDGELRGTINLENMYRIYCATPRAGRANYLRTCARASLVHLKELPDDFESARHDLRLRLWARATLEQQRLRGLIGDASGGPIDIAHEPVGQHLLATLVYDWPESVQSLNGENLSAWGVSLFQAMEEARKNLDEVTVNYARIGDGLYSFVNGDTYDATRLLLTDRIRDWEVTGRHVAIAPNRDTLFVAGSDDEAGLAILAELAAKGLEEGYALSAVPLILGDDGWEDWMPPEDHSLYRRYRELELRWIGPLYTEQKQLLETLHERDGTESFVASYSGVEKQGGELVSYCVWGEGVDTLLPVTHKIAFARAGQDGLAALGEWDRVLEVAGSLMEPTDHYPARYRVRDFPDDSMIAAIGIGNM